MLTAAGQLELDQKYYDYDNSLQTVEIDQVIMGNVIGAGQGQNVARQAMIRPGIPKESSATTINKLCASGMEAVARVWQWCWKMFQPENVIRQTCDLLPNTPQGGISALEVTLRS